MNWYKNIMINSYDWDKTWHRLQKKLKRDPFVFEIQRAMLDEFFSRKHKPDSKDKFYILKKIKEWYKKMKKEKIPGGLASGKSPCEFNSEELAEGAEVEKEHTPDKDIAQEIAMDHLTEDKNYYEKLKTYGL